MWGHKGPFSKRIDRIKEWIKYLQPSLIGLQEVFVVEGQNELFNAIKNLNYNIEFQPTITNEDKEYGNAVLSIWPIEKKKVLILPNKLNAEPRLALTTIINSPFSRIFFTCTHLNWELKDTEVRYNQVESINTFINNITMLKDNISIIVGDFNADPDSKEFNIITKNENNHDFEKRYIDLWRYKNGLKNGYTRDLSNPYARLTTPKNRRVDYIFMGVKDNNWEDDVEIQECKTVCNDQIDGIWPSDHYGVYASIKILK